MQLKLKLFENEYWWGGSSALGDYFPLGEKSDFSMERTYTSNETAPFLVSTKGRYVFSNKAMDITLKNGEFCFESDGEIELDESGVCLRDAYLNGMKKHFPFRGEKLNLDFFKNIQYNTWIECLYHPTQEKVLKYAHEVIEHGFLPGILMIDEGWHGRYGDWRFDPVKFPDPKAMIDELHRLGFKVMLWVIPMVCPDGEFFIHKYIADKDLFMRRKSDGKLLLVEWWNGFSAALDMSKENDRSFLKEQLDALIRDYGVDGFKFDGGNASMYDPKKIVNGEATSELDMYELNQAYNEFSVEYEYHEVKDSYACGGLRQIQRLRDKWHRYEGEGLTSLIPDAAIASLIGHPFICPDMVGAGEYSCFYGGQPVDGELFVRWAQCSALFPMMQFSKKPWDCLSKEHCDMVIEAGKLHDRFTDYIILEVEKSEESGEPILRLLEYSYPNQGFETVKDEFLLGDDILVAPVLAPNVRERKVLFPIGKWQDEGGNIYEGREYTLPAPLDKLLWFRRV